MHDITIWNGDCLDLMGQIPDQSIDMILCDLPYGTTACKWDVLIPFDALWAHYKRIIKPRGAVVLTGSQPFTSMLVMSNPEWFKYAMVWNKRLSGNPLNAPFQPMKIHEDILVFSAAASTYSTRETMVYNPVYGEGEPYERTTTPGIAKQIFRTKIEKRAGQSLSGKRNPTTIIDVSGASRNKVHPTQKPVELFEYLIRTYTNEGETVLDNCLGSGTTAIAAIRSGRRCIGIEKERQYFDVAMKRVREEQAKTALFDTVAPTALSIPGPS